jgi:Outer membrane protein beta-barrel family/CarboxypepD_reg-like domain/TonB-dependent Receptor Plug Domain
MRALLLSFTLLLSSVLGFGQKGKIEGKVIDTKTGQPLTGVTVINKQNGKGTSTDIEGRYSIVIDGALKVSLVFSYNGVTQPVDDIEIKDGVVTVQDLSLTQREKTEDAVVVRAASTSRKANAASLLTFQKNNTALSSGLAADFIKRTPDKNTGEVLRRVSGTSIQDNKFVIVRGLSDRYNAAFINGAALPSSEPDKKAFSFDVIPSTLIDNIIINKTATPDITGEFAGGLVQIQTKDIPSKNEIIVGVSLGFNTQSVFKDFVSNERSSTDAFGFSKGRNLLNSYPRSAQLYDELSVNEQLNISKSFNDRAYDEVNSKAGPIQQYNLTLANVKKFKNGAAFGSIIGLTYRQSKLLFNATKQFYQTNSNQTDFDYLDAQNKYSVNVGAIVNFAWTHKKTKIAFKNLFNQLLEDNYYNRTGNSEDILQDVQLKSSILNQRSLYSAQLEGSHGLNFKNIKLNWNLNFSLNEKSQPDLRVQTYTRSLGTTDVFRLNVRGINTNRFFSDLSDKSYGYNASASLPFKIGKIKQTLKIGGAATVRLRDFKATILGFKEPTDLSLLTLPYNQIFNTSNFKNGGFIFTTDLQTPENSYNGVSALSAGYVMFDNKVSEKIRIVWGARGEYFEQFLKSNKRGTQKAQIVDSKKLDILPSINFTYSLTAKTNIRLAASRTVARPEFREIAAFSFFDFEQLAATAGNDTLKRSSISNYDVRYEFYPKAGEVISFGAFYKSFIDPIELKLNEASPPSKRLYEFTNAKKASLFGIEAEIRKSLSFLNNGKEGWLSNLYFNANASFIISKVTLSGKNPTTGGDNPPVNRPLQGQSPYLINAGFQYDGEKGTNLSLLYNRIGQRLTLVGNNTVPNLFEKPRDLIDLQISQKIFKKKGEVKLTLSDLLNQQIAVYANRDDKTSFNSTNDKYFSTYKPGTTITVGFNYTF